MYDYVNVYALVLGLWVSMVIATNLLVQYLIWLDFFC